MSIFHHLVRLASWSWMSQHPEKNPTPLPSVWLNPLPKPSRQWPVIPHPTMHKKHYQMCFSRHCNLLPCIFWFSTIWLLQTETSVRLGSRTINPHSPNSARKSLTAKRVFLKLCHLAQPSAVFCYLLKLECHLAPVLKCGSHPFHHFSPHPSAGSLHAQI